ncbi:UPF0280 family protein [Oleidesulfovibrio sp.]|uniref:UPF0280 family protein n=1 Tax=Oleidesulfovibrio sp. TaxID=2909707 RepID=UPI003A87DD3B
MSATSATHRIHTSPLRHYRKQHSTSKGNVSFQVVLEETDLWITAPKLMQEEAAKLVRTLRGQIVSWIAICPSFAHSLTPVEVPEHAPEVVRRMAAGAALLEVGPMAAVAGTVAQMVAEGLLRLLQKRAEKNCSKQFDILVENGGDIFMFSPHPRTVGLLPDPESDSVIGLVIPAEAMPLSVCSSSATIGHSLSLGTGDLVSVVASDASIADAAATAFCNMLKNADDVTRVTDRAAQLQAHGIRAVFAQCAGKIGVWGDIELTAI